MKVVVGIVGIFSLATGLVWSASSASAQVLCSNGDLAECRTQRDRAAARLAELNTRISELEALLPTRIAHGANGQENTFTRDTSNPALGDAWRDPSGTVWGDIVANTDANHSIKYMVQSSAYMTQIGRPLPVAQLGALEYCASIGAELPTREDFGRLRGYMGATTAATAYQGTGYTPQVLPNLTRVENGQTHSNNFWSSSVRPDDSDDAYYFDGRYGLIDDGYRGVSSGVAVRCVVRR